MALANPLHLHAGRLITKDRVFGLDTLLFSSFMPRVTGRMMSFVSVYKIQPIEIRELVIDFPRARKDMHSAMRVEPRLPLAVLRGCCDCWLLFEAAATAGCC